MTDKEKLIDEILKRGFKDVTEEEPITMMEMLGDTFSDFNAYSNRFLKEEFGLKIYLLLEVEGRCVEIEGKAIHNFGVTCFHLREPLFFYYILSKHLDEIISELKRKLYELYDGQTKGEATIKED